MRRDLFIHIHYAVIAHDTYFIQKRNAAGSLGLSSLQKMTATIRMFAYGITANLMDEYLRNGERTSMDSFVHFIKVVISICPLLEVAKSI